MKRNLVLCFVIITLSGNTFAQFPLAKQWDKRFGGTSADYMYSMQQLNNGDYLLSGYSWSGMNGDKSQPNWDTANGFSDYWIIRTNETANKIWDKRFGGTKWEVLTSVENTSDNGFMLGGYSDSGIDGDKTEPNWDVTNAWYDYWIVKIDSAGNKQWDKRYGGIKNDLLLSAKATSDGGYILGGNSMSGINGDKTVSNWDNSEMTSDFWIIKIDSSGLKQWDKRYGGTNDDYIRSIIILNDNTYLLAGTTASFGGDISQASQGYDDFWILKIDSAGNKIWDKRYGGDEDDRLLAIDQTIDNGFILGGTSRSGVSGDKSQPTWGLGDYWIIKIDSVGNIEWDKDFGGVANEDEFNSLLQTNDNGFIMAGASYSDSSGNKSENNLGYEQSWVVKTDSSGNKLWDKTIFTSGHDENGYVAETNDGCYIFGNLCFSGIGGYKTEPNWDTASWNTSADFWFVKFCDTTLTDVNSALSFQTQVFVFPNPILTDISITVQKQNLKTAKFAVKNILGQTIFSVQENNISNTYTKTLDLGFLSKGVYLIDVTIDEEHTVKKIVKE